MRSWVGGEGWVALVHDDVEVEVAEKATEREEKREDRSANKTRKEAIFLPTLDLIISSLIPWNPPVFIEGGRGIFRLYWCQILAFDSTRKDPNYWLKVAIME